MTSFLSFSHKNNTITSQKVYTWQEVVPSGQSTTLLKTNTPCESCSGGGYVTTCDLWSRTVPIVTGLRRSFEVISDDFKMFSRPSWKSLAADCDVIMVRYRYHARASVQLSKNRPRAICTISILTSSIFIVVIICSCELILVALSHLCRLCEIYIYITSYYYVSIRRASIILIFARAYILVMELLG